MKKYFSLLFALLVWLFAFEALAQTRLTPNFTTNLLTLLPSVISAGGYSNVVSGTFPNVPVTVNPGYGASLSAALTNSLTTAVTNTGYYINVTTDGSNWLSAPPYYFELKHTAGKTNYFGTNMPSSWFDGYMAWRVEGITNCDLANTISFPSTGGALILGRRRLDYQ